MMENNRGESFATGLLVVLLSIGITLLAFLTEKEPIGFATSILTNNVAQHQQNLLEFRDITSLGSLAVGAYYIDNEGIVYQINDGTSTAIAKVKQADDSQKNRNIYIDANGNVGYLLYVPNQQSN